MTMPKGQSIEDKYVYLLKKVKSRPKGVKISEFPEAHLSNSAEEALHLINNASCMSAKNAFSITNSMKKTLKSEIKSREKNKDLSKTVQAANEEKPKLVDKSLNEVDITFDQEKAKIYANNNNFDLNVITNPESSSIPLKNNAAYWRDFLTKEDLKAKKTLIDRYVKIFEKYKLNKKLLLDKMTYFPMLSKEEILNNKNMYTEAECQLMDELLLEKLETSADNQSNERFLLPSVTRVLELSRSDRMYESLLKWKIEKIETLGLHGFYEYSRKNLMEGNEIHCFIEKCLKELGKENLAKNIDSKLYSEIKRIVALDFKDVQLIESYVTHKNLFYLGKIDCLAYYKGNLCLIDWKTSEKNKSDLKDLYDIPVQLSAYLGAFFNDPVYDELRKKHSINYGLIVNVNKSVDGKLDFHLFNHQLAEFFWHQWLVSLKKFWMIILKERKRLN